MQHYLDPKADLTFKKVFGEHPDLVKSFLNALLPLEDRVIEEIEYLPTELLSEDPLKKNSIVDVCCRDNHGRQFIVEMQMYWTKDFFQRMLFNLSKTYSRQLSPGSSYSILKPVYGLCLINDKATDEESYYNVILPRNEAGTIAMKDIQIVSVELPKFTPKTFAEKKMHVLWLRFLTEISDRTTEVSSDLTQNPEINKAVEIIRKSAFTEAELMGYDKFWDAVSVERTLIDNALEKGMAMGIQQGIEQGIEQGIKQGIEQGIEQGKQEGQLEERKQMAKNLKSMNIPMETIMKATGFSVKEIEKL